MVASLMRSPNAKQADFDWSWTDTNIRKCQIDALIEHFEDDTLSVQSARTSVVWTAGAAGFSSTPEILEEELLAFQDVCVLATRLSKHPKVNDCSVHLTSSAGGIFEGQRRVDHDSIPVPRRPYGTFKLLQEKHLSELEIDARKYVYRPSSVYGYNPGGRAGLVAALIRNANQRRCTKVFGSISTLRDYVFVEDVARFIADQIQYIRPDGTFTLASGKPTSLGEILSLVRWAMACDLLLEIDPNPSNASDNTYLPSLLPDHLRLTDLRTGIERTHRRLVREELIDG